MEKVSRRKATVTNLIYQYSSLILGIIAGLILVPLYLKFIDIKLYGAWLASGNTIAWLALMDPGLNELLRQQVAKFYGEKDTNQLGKAIGTGWVIMTILCVITIGIGALLARYIPALFLQDAGKIGDLSFSIFLASVGAGLVFFSGAPGAVLQGFQRSGRFTIIYIVSTTTGIILTIILLFMKVGLKSLPIGSVVSGVMMSVFCGTDMIYFAKSKLKIHLAWSTEYLRKIKSLIGATFLLQTSRVLTVNCNEFLVGILLGTEIVPLLAFTKRLWDLALMFGQRISVAFMPGLAHLWAEGERKKVGQIAIRMMHVTLFLFGIESAVILAFNHSFLKLWLKGDFFAGDCFNILMALATFFYLYNYAIGQILYAANDIKNPSYAGVIQSILRTLLVLALLKVIGINIVPLATLISSAFMLLVYFRKRFGQYMEIICRDVEFSGIVTVALTTVLGVLGVCFVNPTTWPGLVVSILIGICLSGGMLMIADKVFRSFAIEAIIKIVR